MRAEHGDVVLASVRQYRTRLEWIQETACYVGRLWQRRFPSYRMPSTFEIISRQCEGMLRDLSRLGSSLREGPAAPDNGRAVQSAKVLVDRFERRICRLEGEVGLLANRVQGNLELLEMIALSGPYSLVEDATGISERVLQGCERVAECFYATCTHGGFLAGEHWSGVVVHDWGRPLANNDEHRVIHLPWSAQLFNSGLFALIAHEIGHQVVADGLRQLGVSSPDPRHRDVYVQQIGRVLRRILLMKNDEFADLPEKSQAILDRVSGPFPGQVSPEFFLELAADILATAIMGPAYAIALALEGPFLSGGWPTGSAERTSSEGRWLLAKRVSDLLGADDGWWRFSEESIVFPWAKGGRTRPALARLVEVLEYWLPAAHTARMGVREPFVWGEGTLEQCRTVATALLHDCAILPHDGEWGLRRLVAGGAMLGALGPQPCFAIPQLLFSIVCA